MSDSGSPGGLTPRARAGLGAAAGSIDSTLRAELAVAACRSLFVIQSRRGVEGGGDRVPLGITPVKSATERSASSGGEWRRLRSCTPVSYLERAVASSGSPHPATRQSPRVGLRGFEPEFMFLGHGLLVIETQVRVVPVCSQL